MHQGFLDHHGEVLGFALECVVALVLFDLLAFQPPPVEHSHTLGFCLQVAVVGHCVVQVVEQELGLELEPELELELELELPPSEVGPCIQQVPQCQGWQVVLGCFVEVQVCLPLVLVFQSPVGNWYKDWQLDWTATDCNWTAVASCDQL